MLSGMWKKLDPMERDKYVEKAKRNKKMQMDTVDENVAQIIPMDLGQDDMTQMYYRNDGYMFK